MKTNSFAEELRIARKHRCAVGAFNIFNYLSANAVIQAAEALNTPVILQTSTKTVKAFGPEALASMLQNLARKAKVNVLIHLDHCRDLDLAKACVDAGWDSIMYDGSALPLEENIKNCRTIAAYAHEHGKDVEGEIGRIVGEEEEIKVSETEASGVSVQQTVYFVQQSGIDAVAPAVGTAHGVYIRKPKINFDLVTQLAGQIDTPIVLHGGTGLSEETFRKLIVNGCSKVNISTALKHAYMDGAKEYFRANPDLVEPLGLDQFLSDRIRTTALSHMTIFRKDRID